MVSVETEKKKNILDQSSSQLYNWLREKKISEEREREREKKDDRGRDDDKTSSCFLSFFHSFNIKAIWATICLYEPHTATPTFLYNNNPTTKPHS